MEGFLLKQILFSYDESYVLEMDVQGMIGVKKKYIYYKKAKGDRVLKFHFKNRKGVE
jgi:hypothetical protein